MRRCDSCNKKEGGSNLSDFTHLSIGLMQFRTETMKDLTIWRRGCYSTPKGGLRERTILWLGKRKKKCSTQGKRLSLKNRKKVKRKKNATNVHSTMNMTMTTQTMN